MKTILLLVSGLFVLSAAVLCLVMAKGKPHEAKQGKKSSGKISVKQVSREQSSNTDFSIENIYVRLQSYFENERPYLDSNLTISDVAKRLYTNKAYVSKAVNRHAGLNFCQYVNRYRVFHAMKLLKKEPGLRVTELAHLSGFNSTASINISFRAFAHTTPGCLSRTARRVSALEIPAGNGNPEASPDVNPLPGSEMNYEMSPGAGSVVSPDVNPLPDSEISPEMSPVMNSGMKNPA